MGARRIHLNKTESIESVGTDNRFRKFRIEREGKTIIELEMQQLLACCGTTLIANGALYTSFITQQDKDSVFQAICSLLKEQFSTRNAIYTDMETNGALNAVLGDKFEIVNKYRNPNSDNIVELRTFTLDPSDFDKSEDYDSDDWEEDDDYYSDDY